MDKYSILFIKKRMARHLFLRNSCKWLFEEVFMHKAHGSTRAIVFFISDDI